MKALRDRVNKIVKRFLTFLFFCLSCFFYFSTSSDLSGRNAGEAILMRPRRVSSANCVSLPRQLFARRALDIAEEVATGGWIDFRETVIFLSLTIGMTFAVRRIWWIAVDGWWMRRLFFFRDATESLPLFLEYFIKRFGQRRSLITSKSWVIEEEKEASEPLRWIIARFPKWDSRFAKFSFRGKRFDFFQDERFFTLFNFELLSPLSTLSSWKLL